MSIDGGREASRRYLSDLAFSALSGRTFIMIDLTPKRSHVLIGLRQVWSGWMRHDPRAKADQLRAKLEMFIHYLEMLDLHYHAHGADFTPPGWGGMTVQQMIARLKDQPPQREDGR